MKYIKKIICYVSSFLLLVMSLDMNCFAAEQSTETLATPTNIVWKDGSTATATWDAVDGANYYDINVYVYYDGVEIGNTTTGTTDVELDVQQEIQNVATECSYMFVQVKFSVIADCINGEETTSKSVVSELSEEKDYLLNAPTVGKPQNLNLTEDCVLTWDELANADRYNYQVNIYKDGEYKGCALGTIYQWTATNGKCSYDFSESIKEKVIKLGLSGVELTVNAVLRPYGEVEYNSSTYEVEGELADYSNKIEYMLDENAPTVGKPQNLNLTEDCVLTWDELVNADRYNYQVNIYKDGEYKGCALGTIYQWTTTNGKCLYDFSESIKEKVIKLGLSGIELTVNAVLRPYGEVEYNSSTYEVEGELADYSNTINYNSMKIVQSITCSPQKPIIHLGNAYSLGKTITPIDAYYSSIDWATTDSSVVSVDTEGKITGVAVGSATVTAAIGTATDSVDVTVYEVSSNIEDSEQKEAIENQTGDIIDDINNNDEPDLDDTDIDDDSIDDAKDEIKEGIENGDEFSTDIDTEKKDTEETSQEDKDKVEEKYPGAVFTGEYEVSLDIYHKDQYDEHHHIGNIIHADTEVGFYIEIPKDVLNENAAYDGTYELVIVEDGTVKNISLTRDEKEKCKFHGMTDYFGDYMLIFIGTDEADMDAECKGHTISLNGSIGINFYMSLSDTLKNSTTAYMEFTMPNGSIVCQKVTDAYYSSDTDSYVFTCDVAAAEMASQVSARMVLPGRQNKYSDTFTYSVKEYADYIISHSDQYSEKVVNLVEAMLNYGAYAQQYFSINVTLLANENAYKGKTNPVCNRPEFNDRMMIDFRDKMDSNQLTFVGGSLVCRSQTYIKLYFKPDKAMKEEEYTVSVSFNNKEKSCAATMENGFYVVYIYNIAAAELDETFNISIVNSNDENQSFAFDYSPMIYISNAQNHGDRRLIDLTRAMFYYNEAANAYFD